MSTMRSGDAVYADDLEVGRRYPGGAMSVTEDEMIAFASAWDPQAFHVDRAVAARGHFGGIIASGIQTFGVFHRLAVTTIYRDWRIIAGRRVDRLEFPAPLRPDVVVRAEVVVEAIKVRDENRSVVAKHGMLRDGTGAVAFEMHAEAYMERRPPLNARVDTPALPA
jgi:acyl dehydratase